MPPGQLSELQKPNLQLRLDQLSSSWLGAAEGEGGRKVQPSPGSEKRVREIHPKPTASEDKGTEPWDWRATFDDTQEATSSSCTSHYQTFKSFAFYSV